VFWCRLAVTPQTLCSLPGNYCKIAKKERQNCLRLFLHFCITNATFVIEKKNTSFVPQTFYRGFAPGPHWLGGFCPPCPLPLEAKKFLELNDENTYLGSVYVAVRRLSNTEKFSSFQSTMQVAAAQFPTFNRHCNSHSLYKLQAGPKK